jgi:redox-sensitive bicupin YhaK (pirin superfamily)
MSTTWTHRPAHERGYANHGWLETRHTFSFALYYDPAHMGFGPLRVINDDRVAPGQGFGQHGHRDMEILSYIVDGSLEHRDTLGNGSVLRSGQVQLMSAGTGIKHSEFNASQDKNVRFLQIWVKPNQRGLKPGYQERSLAAEPGLELIASPDGEGDAFILHQDARIHALRLGAGGCERYELKTGRALWVQAVEGTMQVLGDESHLEVQEGDGLSIESEGVLEFKAGATGVNALIFELSSSDL